MARLKFILKSPFTHALLNMYVSCSTKPGEQAWQSLTCHIENVLEHLIESFFAPNRSQSESEKNGTEEEQCTYQEQMGEDRRKPKKS